MDTGINLDKYNRQLLYNTRTLHYVVQKPHCNGGLFFFRNVLDQQPDVGHPPIIGPALRVGGNLFDWKGPPPSQSVAAQPLSKLAVQGRATQSESALNLTAEAQLTSTASLADLPSPVASQLQLQFQQEYIHKQPTELRVNFEGKPKKMTTSYLEMENCGTTAVYYSWQVCTVYMFVCLSSQHSAG